MSRSPEYTQGRRAGVKWAITWLHARAAEMNDPPARAILNSAAFNMGHDARNDGGKIIEELRADGQRADGETTK